MDKGVLVTVALAATLAGSAGVSFAAEKPGAGSGKAGTDKRNGATVATLTDATKNSAAKGSQAIDGKPGTKGGAESGAKSGADAGAKGGAKGSAKGGAKDGTANGSAADSSTFQEGRGEQTILPTTSFNVRTTLGMAEVSADYSDGVNLAGGQQTSRTLSFRSAPKGVQPLRFGVMVRALNTDSEFRLIRQFDLGFRLDRTSDVTVSHVIAPDRKTQAHTQIGVSRPVGTNTTLSMTYATDVKSATKNTSQTIAVHLASKLNNKSAFDFGVERSTNDLAASRIDRTAVKVSFSQQVDKNNFIAITGSYNPLTSVSRSSSGNAVDGVQARVEMKRSF